MLSHISRLAKSTGLLTSKALNHGQIRYSGDWVYRSKPLVMKNWNNIATGTSAFMYFWIFWHLYHEPGHVFGEFDFPDSSKWTDEELGIPPDDLD